jgi:succinate-semialdehyde dehydrogenase/glutarate-semialdehyde dehydrogenase
MTIERMDTDATICIAPATGEMIGDSQLNSGEDVRKAVEAGRAAQAEWASLPVKERVKRIKPLRAYLVEHADELAQLICQDNGKTRVDALATEVLPAAMAVDYYCRMAMGLLKERRLMPSTLLMANKASKIIRVPYGVVGIISPWNYPFSIPFSEVIMALLAGNAVVLKAASETQLVGRAIERCINRLDLAPGLFSYINMPGRLAGKAFLEAGVHKLFFTGSVMVGQELMAEAAHSLTPLVLELGGNDPMLVCPDADLQRAAAGAVWAGLQNCGQSCGGVERIYVHRSVYQPFLNALAARVKRLRVGVDTGHEVDLGAMTTAKQAREVKRQVVAATKAGAVIYARSQAPAGTKGNFLPAMVLTKVDHSMEIMRLETFGPVLCVMPVVDMAQAVALANDSNLGLSASVWTRKAKEGQRLARQIKAGVVMINDHLMSHGLPENPWGGFKHSGFGRTHGALGMLEMTQPQCIVADHMPFVKRNLWWYPQTPAVYRGMRAILDLLYGQTFKKRLKALGPLLWLVPRMFRSDVGRIKATPGEE